MARKYLQTNRKERNTGMRKRGSATKGTDGAHLLSHRVAEGILSRTPGRGGHGTGKDTSAKAISEALNDDSNIRIKTKYGNRILDERRDRRINRAHANGTNITENTTAKRAVQAYKGSQEAAKKSGNRAVAQISREIGEMTYNDGMPGRPKKIKTMAKEQKIQNQNQPGVVDRLRKLLPF